MRALSRGRAVMVVLLVGTALLGSTLGTWVGAPVRTTIGSGAVAVPGSQAVPVVAAAGLVLLAAGLAIGLAGRLARVGAAVVVALAGVLAGTATLTLLRDPRTVAEAAAAARTGVPELAGPVTLTAWPYVAVVLSVVALVVGVALPFLMGRWGVVGRRYQREALGGGAPGAPAVTGTVGGTRAVRSRAMDDWDALSRGEDPTLGREQ